MPDSLFERTVKQTLRFLMIDEKLLLDTVSKGHALKNQNMPKTTPGTLYEHIRSPGFLKEFYSNPNYNIDLLLKTERQGLSEKQHKQKNTGIEFTTAQKDIIMNFIKDINTHKPASIQNWITLHHYIYYIYRRFVTVDPSTDKDDIPDVMIKRIRYLLESLLNCDPTQLYIKVFSTVRDFIIAARICSEETHINIKEPLRYLSTFLTYYNALCAAAQKLTTVIPEFDRLLSFYNFNWLRFNKMLFYTYFFKSISVQNKLNEIEKQQMGCSVSHEKLRESYGLFLDDMNQTNGAWMTQTLRIENISKNLNSEDFKNDLNVCDREATLLYVNYWVSRSFEQKKYEINLNRFVGYLLSWMGNITNMAPSLVDHKGRCQCEECVLEQFITYNSDDDFSSTFVRYIKCDLCRTNCILEKFAAHLNNHHSENNTHPTKWHLNSKLDQEQAIKNVSSKVCKVLSETIEDLRVNSAYLKKQAMKGAQTLKIAEGADCVIQTVPNTRERLESFNTPFDCVLKDPVFSLDRQATTEPIIKIASEPPLFKDSHVMDISSLANCETNYKMSFQDFVKEKCDETTENCLRFDAFLKNAEEMAKSDCKKDLADIKDKIRKCEDLAAAKISIDDNKLKKCVPNTTTETELKDTAQSKISRSSNHSCNHNCKHDELGLAESKKGCHSNCDHHKEARKCDCTYCEVFGTTMPSHFHKANETRDRLRSRLNQRKERHENLRSCIDKTPNPLPYPNLNKPNSVNNNGDTNSGTVINAPTNKSSAKTNVTKPNIVPFERVPNMANLISPPEKPGNKTPPVVTPSNNAETCSLQPSISSLSTSSLNSLCKDNSRDSRDINDLLDFIEGNRKNFRKIVLAEKKAAKKARQKLKKEEERLRFEKEEREKEEQRIREQKRLEEEQMRAEALAKQFVEKLKKNKNKTVDSKLQTQKQNNSKSKKNKNCKNNDNAERQLIEETIPAMVTIKRVVENNSPPTVTITLKGSTPDQDKLLYTLVNGHTKETNENNNLNAKKNKTSNTTNNNNNNKATNNSDNKESKKSKKKKDKDGVVEKCKELKVTLSVDNICTKVDSKKANNKNKTTENNKASQKQNDKSTTKVNNSKDVGINIPMLRLPPGITITKVDGPINKNCKASSNDNLNQNTNIPVSKSGVIVVDTEKLIQNKSASASTSAATNNKKNKKKKNSKNEAANENSKSKKNSSSTPMVTLKNPIFHTLQTTLASKTGDKSTPEVSNIMPCNQQASIIKNENGMVTIRSPRLQHSLTGGAVIPNLLAELKPVIGPEVSTPYLQSCHSNFNEKNVSQFNAQEILSGLPGIEITKVEKRVAKDDGELKKSCQAADVSIIPSNGNDKFYFDKDDWPFESVFTPKDILEDDLDAEERELEAFKRFCQQSVPPKRKEKVTHLNVKDIILMKKNDYAFN